MKREEAGEVRRVCFAKKLGRKWLLRSVVMRGKEFRSEYWGRGKEKLSGGNWRDGCEGQPGFKWR